MTLTAILCRPHRLRCLRFLRSECESGKFFIFCPKPFVNSLVYLRRSCPTPQRSCNSSLGSKKPMKLFPSFGASVSRRVIGSTVRLFFSRALNSLAKLSGLPVVQQSSLGLIDSHAHIQGKEYTGETAEIIQLAGEAGVEQIIVVGGAGDMSS